MHGTTSVDYLIIGAGPAGLQLGYFLEKAGRSYLIVEAGNSPGTFFKRYPRHGKLISINKVYTGYNDHEINLRWDWNSLLSDSEALRFKNYSREYFPHTDALVEYLHDFAAHFNLKIQYNCEVTRITKSEGRFVVSDRNGNQYSGTRLIMAGGFTKPYIPQIPGIELAENYTEIPTDPEAFANQRVLIIGKGNSAFETADCLIGTTAVLHVASRNPLSLAWKTKYVGHLRAVNNNFLDTYQLKSQNAVIDAAIDKIERRGNQFVVSFSYAHANGEQEDLVYDRIIACTGFRFDAEIFDESCRPELTIYDRFPAQTSEWESINVKELYFAGVLMHMRDFKKKQSGFIHGFRYNIQALHWFLERKYHQQELPYRMIDATPESLTKAILDRVNVSSALWQQTGFLCDVIVVSQNGKTARYYEQLPKDYVLDSELGQNQHYYLVSLEFGYDVDKMPDPFAINRVHKDDAVNAAQSAFLHPIVRRFQGDTLLSEHHVIEDLEAEWKEDVHIQPLLAFLHEDFAQDELSFSVLPLNRVAEHSDRETVVLNKAS